VRTTALTTTTMSSSSSSSSSNDNTVPEEDATFLRYIRRSSGDSGSVASTSAEAAGAHSGGRGDGGNDGAHILNDAAEVPPESPIGGASPRNDSRNRGRDEAKRQEEKEEDDAALEEARFPTHWNAVAVDAGAVAFSNRHDDYGGDGPKEGGAGPRWRHRDGNGGDSAAAAGTSPRSPDELEVDGEEPGRPNLADNAPLTAEALLRENARLRNIIRLLRGGGVHRYDRVAPGAGADEAGMGPSDAAKCVAVVAPPDGLARRAREVQPGAFHVPGPAERNGDEQEHGSASSVDAVLALMPPPPSTTQRSGTILLEADLVLERVVPHGDGRSTAAALLVEATLIRPRRQMRAMAMLIRRKREVIAVAIVTAIVVGGAVGLGLTINRPADVQPELVDDLLELADSGYLGPFGDDFSLTSTWLQIQNWLPKSTLEAIKRGGTPQAAAHNWLLEGDPKVADSTDFVLRMIHRFALATLYYSTGGNNTWVNNYGWLDRGLHECFWDRVTCPGFPSRPSSIEELKVLRNMSNVYVSMVDIQRIDLSNNGLVGTLPDELRLLRMSNIQFLQFEENALSGPIPTSLGDLSGLEMLSLSSNSLTGTIPPSLGNLMNVQRLWIFNTSLTGPIPVAFVQLLQLGELKMGQNRLHGTIPSELGLMRSLVTLDLDRNQLTGTLPSELFNMTRLTSLSLFANALTGSIPWELGFLTQLDELQLHGNRIGGSVPAEVCALMLSATPLNLTIDCDRVQCPCERACGCGAS
jgi:hypothetical protein